jgi:hypothetical protein
MELPLTKKTFFFGGSSVRIVSKKHLHDRPEDQINRQWPRPRPHADRKTSSGSFPPAGAAKQQVGRNNKSGG